MKSLLILLSGLIAINSSHADGLSKNPLSKPNIIVILADDLGYGDLSSYGNNTNKTPNLDKLALEGLRFTDFHSSGTVCSPTRAGLVTGRYQQRTGVDGVVNADPKHPAHGFGVDPETEITYPELLKAQGYKNGLVGKWHLGYLDKYHPMNFGFDRFVGFVSGNIDYISHYDRMDTYDWWHDRNLVKEPGYSTHLITQHALSFIEKNKAGPFTLLIAHEAVHSPLQAPGDPIQRGPNRTNEQPDRIPAETYRLMLQALDDSVGAVVKAVKQAGIAENTLIFFTSDNGPMPFASPGLLRGRKGSIFEGGHRVPAIAWWPKTILPNQVTDQLAISLDLMPTMIQLANASVPENHHLDGLDLLPVLTGEKLKPRQLYWRNGGLGGKSKNLIAKDSPKAIRDGKWKLVAQPNYSSVMLFDLNNDIAEQHNVTNLHPEITQRLVKQLKTWEQEMLQHLPYTVK